MKYIKYLPLTLFTISSIKGVIVGFNLESVASLLVLGAAAFLYEKYSQDQAIASVQAKTEDEIKSIKLKLEELESIKSKMSSLQMQNMRPGSSMGQMNKF